MESCFGLIFSAPPRTRPTGSALGRVGGSRRTARADGPRLAFRTGGANAPPAPPYRTLRVELSSIPGPASTLFRKNKKKFSASRSARVAGLDRTKRLARSYSPRACTCRELRACAHMHARARSKASRTSPDRPRGRGGCTSARGPGAPSARAPTRRLGACGSL